MEIALYSIRAFSVHNPILLPMANGFVLFISFYLPFFCVFVLRFEFISFHFIMQNGTFREENPFFTIFL